MKRNIGGLMKMSVTMAVALSVPLSALAASPTPAQKCEKGKNRAANSYVDCLTNAQSKLIYGTSDMVDYAEDIADCDLNYGRKWQKLETEADGACPSTGDEAAVQSFLDACVISVQEGLAGNALPLDVATCNDDLVTCDADLSAAGSDLLVCEGDLSTTNADLSICETALDECEALPIGQVTKTGQTICQDGSGNVIACAGTGLDGELQKGIAPSFTVNGDGTTTDNNTGLMWENLSDDGSIHDQDATYTLADAIGVKIAALNGANFAGYGDWRLPNVKELLSIVAYDGTPSTYATFSSTCSGGCGVLACNCTVNGPHWTSTNNPYHGFLGHQVNFFNGTVQTDSKSSTAYVRAVRGGA